MCKKCNLQFELQSLLQIISGIQYRDEIYANAEINQRLSYLLLLHTRNAHSFTELNSRLYYLREKFTEDLETAIGNVTMHHYVPRNHSEYFLKQKRTGLRLS